MRIHTRAVTAISIAVLLWAAGATAADKKAAGPLQLPVRGVVAGIDGATFAGTLSIQTFVARDGQVMAIGMVRGSVTSATGAPIGTALVGPIELPVSVGPGPAATAAPKSAAAAPAQPTQVCDVLHIQIGAVSINLLGLQVTTLPIDLDLSADPTGTNVLGHLVCTILDTLNNVIGLVDLLNQLLALLTGLLGAIIPG